MSIDSNNVVSRNNLSCSLRNQELYDQTEKGKKKKMTRDDFTSSDFWKMKMYTSRQDLHQQCSREFINLVHHLNKVTTITKLGLTQPENTPFLITL